MFVKKVLNISQDYSVATTRLCVVELAETISLQIYLLLSLRVKEV